MRGRLRMPFASLITDAWSCLIMLQVIANGMAATGPDIKQYLQSTLFYTLSQHDEAEVKAVEGAVVGMLKLLNKHRLAFVNREGKCPTSL